MSDRSLTSIDTNVLLRHLLRDHDEHSPRRSALFRRVRRRQQAVFCPDTAIFEAIHILHGRAGAPRDRTASSLLGLIELQSFHMTHKSAIKEALALWQEHSALDYADCCHLTLTKALGMSRIYTFDRRMNRYPGVERVKP